MDVLDRVSPAMLARLQKVIEKEYEYFTLSGSDPASDGGCCPSGDVGMANLLVRAGVLDSWEKPTPKGGCTFTVYSFRGEMDKSGATPVYTLDRELRQELLGHIRKRMG